ncbi:GMC family oxidoreductase [Nocardia tengchongensis]|uniref:GMC family oxidoreductase n=1 Tax=Nocardia tengchongensis TaxID=2055889 RepID=UPI0033F9F73C
MTTLSDTQRATIRMFCDTVVPSIERADDPDGLWARSASELGVPEAVEQTLLGMPPETLEGMRQLLDGLARSGFATQSQSSRELTLKITGPAFGVAAQAGIGGLIKLVLMLTYALPDPATGRNPNWTSLRYPGPIAPPPATPKKITPVVPEGDSLELETDVAIVGSGAGGAVIAAELTRRGVRVVVVEAGQYRNEADFFQLELPAYQQTYWRGGPQTTADLNFTVLAGATLGGGTVINWANCLRTTERVREEWATAGLTDVATDFDRHLDAVAERIGVTAEASELNPLHERIRAAARRFGWHTQIAEHNVDPSKHDPATAAYYGFGDQAGAKQSTLLTYLQDAADGGARIVVGTTVHRVLVEDGRAAGIVGAWNEPETGRSATVTVRARQVVVAAGSVESPALLLRSRIGGPAVGQHLRLHPTTGALAIFDEDVKAWWGSPHTLLIDEFERSMEHGFRLEGSQYAPGLLASAAPFTTARQHKALIEQFGKVGGYLARIRDHGGGRVVIDADGQAQVTYDLNDPVDVAAMRKAIECLVRLLAESGALEIQPLATIPAWRRGDGLEAYLQRLRRVPLRFGGVSMFTAHQMGSCRMGADPATSVADPAGQLHDTPGVWIGDASAFPTASGTNPMLSVMALAHRTAEAIADAVVPASAATTV